MKGILKRTAARLKKKLGPLPLWVWVAIVLVAGIWYVRRNAAASAATTTSTTAADTTATQPDTSAALGSGSGGGGSSPSPTDPSSTAPVSWDPSQLASLIASDLPQQPAQDPGTGTAAISQDVSQPSIPAGSPTRTSAGTPILSPSGKVVTQIPSGATVVPEPPSAKNPGPNLPIVVPAGSTNVKRTASGAVTYTTPSGAQIEQAPGSSRYVTKAAPALSAPRSAAAAAPSRTSAAPATVAPVRKASGPAVTPAHTVAPAAKPAAGRNKAV